MRLNRFNWQTLRRWVTAYWPLVIPLLVLLPWLNRFPYPSPEAFYSDLTISHYPNAVFLRTALARWGRVPLWSPTILSGYPFAANPLSSLWYPPGWLALLLPLPLGFNLLIGLHLLLGAVGLTRFLRLEDLSRRAALLGGLAFAALPKLYAHYGAGHLTLLYAVPWTPWLLVSAHRNKLNCLDSERTSVECCEANFAKQCIETSEREPRQSSAKPKTLGLDTFSPSLCVPSGGRKHSTGALEKFLQRFRARSHQEIEISFRYAGLILALIFLADPRWAPFAGLLWWGYALAASQFGEKKRPIPFGALSIQTALALLLSGPLLIPLLEYVGLSTRSQLASADVFSHSLPPARLLGLLFPDFGGFHEWSLYPGAVVLLLALAALWASKRRGRVWFWLAVFGLSLLFSLGSHLPGLAVLARLPGLSLLRVPPRALFLTGMAFAILAAYGLDSLDAGAVSGRVTLVWMGLSGFAFSLALGVRALTGAWAWPFVWGAGALLAGSLWGLARLHRWLPAASGFVILVAIAGLDWGAVNTSLLSFRSKEIVLSQGEEMAAFLAAQPGRFRVYSPSYSLPQHTAARYGLALADGVDPMQLAAYAELMDAATGVPRSGYSVTLPPFAGGEPKEDNAAYRPDPGVLGLLNVRYVAAEFDLPVDGLVFVDRFGETRLYENALALPRAWVQSEEGIFEDRAELIEWQPNRITIQAEGPGTLVLSEIAYPGWQVRVDEQAAAMKPVIGLLRGVDLAPGEHRVVFRFVPLSVILGLLASLLGLVGVAWVGRCQRRVRG